MKTLILSLLLILSGTLSSQNIDDNCNLTPIMKNGKYGFENDKGRKIIKFLFDYAEAFNENLALVKLNNKYGFINCDGEIVIEPTYDFATSFKDGYAKVRKDSLESLIDRSEKLFRDQWYYSISEFHDGFTKVCMENNDSTGINDNDVVVAYMNKRGEILGNHYFSGGAVFKKYKAKVAINGITYYLNILGQLKEREEEECDDALLFGSCYRFNANIEESSGGEEPPQFPGGDSERIKFLQNTLKYPENARENGISGTVFVTFIVSKDGEILRPEILRGVHPSLDEEAINAIKSFPKWSPATMNGIPVCVRFNMPIKFTLAR